jgi:SSS family solute:Na+ symporter
MGFALGVSRLVIEFMSKEGIIEVKEGSLVNIFLDINFLHFAIILFVICAVVMTVVSRLSTPQSEESLRLVTFQRSGIKTKLVFTTDVILTIILIFAVLALWVYFSPWGIAN